MNVLLLRPNPPKESIGLQSFMICEPLELEYVSALLKQSGHTVTILDMILEKKPLAYFLDLCKPDVVGFTAYINHVGVVIDYAETIKQWNRECTTVVGGIYAEVQSSEFEHPSIDYIVKVNALKTFQDLISGIENNLPDLKENIEGVWNGAHKSYTIEQSFNYPHPDREAVADYRDRYNYIFHSKCATLKTSFGCAYSCEFCFCVEITQHTFFERDLYDVIAEIQSIKQKNIFIVDDNFLFKKDRINKFCDLLEENNINKNFILFGRADFIINNEDVIERFSSLGLDAIFVGLESFKEDELIDMKKRVSVETNVKAIHILEKHNIECHCGMIVGPDWETHDFNHLADWLNTFKRIFVNIQPLAPMPGTPVFEKLKSRIVVPRDDYGKWDMAHLLIKPGKMSTRTFYWNIIKTYYKTTTSLKSHFYILNKYGFATYFRTFKGSIHLTMQYLKMLVKG